MKKSILSLIAYTFSFLISISFFAVLFKIISISLLAGWTIVLSMLLLSFLLFFDEILIEDMEEVKA